MVSCKIDVQLIRRVDLVQVQSWNQQILMYDRRMMSAEEFQRRLGIDVDG